MTENTKNPLVSITVITYNSSKFVLETLESIKAQTYQNIELIVSDDCSKDNTVEVCREWIEKNKERFINTHLITSPVNTGIPANKNRALAVCKGEWIKGIAGDDALLEDCIENYIEHIQENPSVRVIHSAVAVYRDSFEKMNLISLSSAYTYKINEPDITAKQQFKILLRINKIRAATAMIQKTVFEEVGNYDERYKRFEDRPMWLKITKNNIKLTYINIVSVNYRKHSSSVTSKNTATYNLSQVERINFLLTNYSSDYSWLDLFLHYLIYRIYRFELKDKQIKEKKRLAQLTRVIVQPFSNIAKYFILKWFSTLYK